MKTLLHSCKPGQFLLMLLILSACVKPSSSPTLIPSLVEPTSTLTPASTPIVLTGDYLGQALPGSTAELFAPGILSTADIKEWTITFTPDGQEIYYSIAGQSGDEYAFAILHLQQQPNGEWTLPRVAPFSGKYRDMEATVSPDGKRLFFVSNRPLSGEGAPKDYDIWYLERTTRGWSEPHNLGAPVNTGGDEFYPSIAANGTLYYTAYYTGTFKDDIYYSRLVDGQYATPEALGAGINTVMPEFNAYVAPDESYLIFSRPPRLLISFRNADGSWDFARDMGPEVNDYATLSYSPALSPDGKLLFFASQRRPPSALPPLTPNFDEILAGLADPLSRAILTHTEPPFRPPRLACPTNRWEAETKRTISSFWFYFYVVHEVFIGYLLIAVIF